ATAVLLGVGVLIGTALSCTASGVTSNIAARVVQARRRTLAFGIVGAAGSIGALVTAPVAAELIKIDGWRTGLLFFAIIGVAMLPAAFLGSSADRLPNSTPLDRNLTMGY